ncbi:MAG TPA: D-alanyl-D-alanine carboxypeptidase/D-alanyl-D-alanine-endopeptidase, partial [Polyangiaceae bacterium]|nr:D-alanyl-D-alanine carboxypeptidase/D-alanyl-D-alanine-endopeptidase [Polyangiaceae bacterium]
MARSNRVIPALAFPMVAATTAVAGVPTAVASSVASSTAPVGVSSPATAATDDVTARIQELGAWVTAGKGRFGAAVVDVATGKVLAAYDEHRPMNPASNTKILTAAAALDRFGPDYRFSTGVYGKITDGVVAPLVIRGNGDPSLSMDDLWELARALKALGAHRVAHVLVDQSYFDANFVPPAFASQPNEWAPFRAPVSAVALDENSVTLTVVPGRSGEPAAAWFDPPGFVDVHGTITTRPKTPNDTVRLSLFPDRARLRAELGGTVGEGAPRVRFSKRVDDPRLFAGYALAEILRLSGVEVTGGVDLGGESAHARLAYVESEPLAVLVRKLGKDSDNFYAETLFKALGAFHKSAPLRWEDGADAVVEWMKSVGAFEPGTKLTNGSGLFDANLVTAMSLATALRVAYSSPRIGPDFAAQLAVGGVDGT